MFCASLKPVMRYRYETLFKAIHYWITNSSTENSQAFGFFYILLLEKIEIEAYAYVLRLP